MTEYERRIKPDRDAWRDEIMELRAGLCMVCQRNTNGRVEVHEIERRSHAKDRWGQRCNYLAVCPTCHHTRIPQMPHAWQLAVKMLCDPQHYDLEGWMRIRDPELKAPNRVEQREVDAFVLLVQRELL